MTAASTPAPHSDTDDITVELTKDHDEVRAIFAELRGGATGDRREALVRDVTEELVKHSVAEEVHLYPLVRAVLPDGDQIADKEISEHAEVEQALKKLERLDPGDAMYDATIDTVVGDVTQHAQEEEDVLFVQLRQQCTPEQLREYGDKIRSVKKVAPTHPHPSSPSTPPANKVMGPMVGLVDRVRDAMRG